MTGTSSRSFDAVVVGGGIAGVSASWALARRGQRVALVEREASLA
ncbi:MAG: FAD-dependent oxidoreductase, partial [Acidimicrobiaceae bacterium]|nr:FAD-dependent oxidoreductase [Acidimicrobiaceae bacterium]